MGERPGYHGPLILGLALLLALAMVAAATMGFMRIPAGQVLAVLVHHLTGAGPRPDPVRASIILDVRLPRILAATLVGGSLSVCGAVFQAILRNPLADPYTLGISSGAAFGASLVIVLQLFGMSMPPGLTIPVFAFVGSLATLAAVLALASGDRRLSSTSLILSGVIVAAILSAAIGFLKFLADEQVGMIIFWLMGSLSGVSWTNIAALAPVAILGGLFCLVRGREMNIMATGERSAATLGVRTVRERWLLLTICSLMTAVSVAVAGIIGFVGLIVPHLLRHLLGPDNRVLVPASFFGGGLLLVLADTLTRAVLPAEVPIGVLTALIGGPVFCIIFKRRQEGGGGF